MNTAFIFDYFVPAPASATGDYFLALAASYQMDACLLAKRKCIYKCLAMRNW
jgi:hypothetical protein